MRQIFLIYIIALMIITGCKSQNIEYDYPKSQEEEKAQELGSLFGKMIKSDDFISEQNNNKKSYKKNIIEEKKLIWQAALDITKSLPLISADYNSGIIITDWYKQPNKDNEKYKLTIILEDEKVNQDIIEVRLHKKVKTRHGWNEVKINPNLIIEIKNKILERKKYDNPVVY